MLKNHLKTNFTKNVQNLAEREKAEANTNNKKTQSDVAHKLNRTWQKTQSEIHLKTGKLNRKLNRISFEPPNDR